MSHKAVASGSSGSRARVRRRLPMEVYERRPGMPRRKVGERPSAFASDLGKVCGLKIKPKSLCQREIELLLEEEDESDDADYDLVEGPLFGLDDDDTAMDIENPRVSGDRGDGGGDGGDDRPSVGDVGDDDRPSVGDAGDDRHSVGDVQGPRVGGDGDDRGDGVAGGSEGGSDGVDSGGDDGHVTPVSSDNEELEERTDFVGLSDNDAPVLAEISSDSHSSDSSDGEEIVRGRGRVRRGRQRSGGRRSVSGGRRSGGGEER